MTAASLPGAMSAPVRSRQSARGAIDPLLLVVVGLLMLIGVLAIYTSSSPTALDQVGDKAYFLKRHLLWSGLGLLAAGVAATIDHRTLQRYSVVLFFGTLALLVALLAIAGPINGSSRWLLASGSIQPSELAKLTVVVYIADWLSERREEIREWAFGIIPYSILMGIVCGLIIMQRDYSTAVLILMVASAMFFVAGAQLQQMLVAGSVAGLVLLGFLLSEQYRIQRVRTFLNPEADPYNAGYQILQALGSFQSGGMAGVGLGRGQIKHAFPMGTAHTDAIYAVIAEETGALGCLLLIVLFGLLAWRGLKIAAGSPDRFSGLLATGITAWLTFQALINMAVVARLMPFTGIPMPFVSFGGSSLVTCMAGVGLLANISRRSKPAEARLYAPLDLRRRNRRARLSRVHRARRAGRRG